MKNIAFGKIICLAILVVFSVFIVKEVFFFIRAYRIDFEKPAYEKLQASAHLFDSAFAKARMLTADISNNLTSELLKKAAMRQFMETLINDYPIDGLFFAVETDKQPEEPHSYALLLSKQEGFIDLRGFHQQTTSSEYKEWYRKTLETGKSWWTNPVFDKDFGARIVGCCVPFHLKNGEKGVVIVIYCTTHIYERWQQLGLSRYGLPYIMDSTTVFVAHPLDEIRSLSQLGKDYGDRVLIQLTNDLTIRKQLGKDYIHRNTVTRKLCNEIFAPIQETGWLAGLSIYDGHSLESATYQESMKKSGIRLILFVSVWFLVLIVFINEYILSIKRDSFYCYFFPLLFVSIIAGTIIIYNRFPVNGTLRHQTITDDTINQIKIHSNEQTFLNQKEIYNKWDPHRIVDTRSLNEFLTHYREQSQQLYKEPVKTIPTGLYVHTIQFLTSYEIRVAGSVWQKFMSTGTSLPDHLKLRYHTCDYPKKGILFPGAEVNEYELTDSIPIVIDGSEAVLCRWTFDVNLSQQLSYSLFPFGQNEIVLPVWSVDLDDNTVLTPDLYAYKQLYPDICPGLGNNFEINGWNILNTYYSYRMESYLCNFGNIDMRGVNHFPELLFNISVSRKFLDSLVCKIIPIVIVLVLLFTILFVREDDDGFNNVIGCSGLFFVLIFDHINLRESVLSEGIMYLEYCYFFTYLLLLLITVTSFSLETNTRMQTYLKWTDSLLKRYFWGIILGFMAAATVFIFY